MRKKGWCRSDAPTQLRHSAISRLLNSGADPFAVQKLAGLSDVRLTTQTYAHVQAEVLRRAAGVLDRLALEGKTRPDGRHDYNLDRLPTIKTNHGENIAPVPVSTISLMHIMKANIRIVLQKGQ